jgi:membrane protein
MHADPTFESTSEQRPLAKVSTGEPVMTRSGSLVSRTWHEFSDDHCTLLAAAIAYYVLFSIIPLITLMFAVFGFIMRNPQSQQGVVDRILQTIPLGQSAISDSIRSVSGQSGALSIIGLVGLIWASTGMFDAIRSALNIAWNVESQRGLFKQKLLDLGAVFGLGILMAASLAGTLLVHFLQTSLRSGTVLSGPLQPVITLAALLLPAVISFVAFLLIYRNVPNVRHGTGDVWPGALLAAVLFELSKHGFAFYVAHFNNYQAAYGVLGGVMLFMLWTYLASIILLMGAEFASEFEKGHHKQTIGSRTDKTVENASSSPGPRESGSEIASM